MQKPQIHTQKTYLILVEKISSHLRNTNFSFLHYVNEYVTALRQRRWGNRWCLPRLPPRQCFLIGRNSKSHV